MNAIAKWAITMSLLSGAAYGQVPSTNDTSSENGNTGVGTGALSSGGPGQNPGQQNTATGEYALGDSGSASSYNTAAGFEALEENSTGQGNSATGYEALFSNFSGSYNTATGYFALANNDAIRTGVSGNTADGAYALQNNYGGIYDTAVGFQSLQANVSGDYNAAVGYNALAANTASFNAALGSFALAANTSGGANTGVGNSALKANQSGANNTAIGSNALYLNDSENTGASGNTADGAGAMNNNTTGNNNTAVGWQALQGTPNGASGSNNTGIGVDALLQYSIGSNNIAVGYEAGINVTTGSSNIEIGSAGAAGDNKLIRIGTQGMQKKTFIAGIYGNSAVSGLAVVIGSNGELGAVSSSERFKTDIAPMGSKSEKLRQLRPVTFQYKADAQGALRYGLIAEEVAKVYPELVVRDEEGRIDGVRYDELAPMLVNELQKQGKMIDAQNQRAATQADKVKSQAAEIRNLKQQQMQYATVAEVNALKQQLQAALTALQGKEQLVAQR